MDAPWEILCHSSERQKKILPSPSRIRNNLIFSTKARTRVAYVIPPPHPGFPCPTSAWTFLSRRTLQWRCFSLSPQVRARAPLITFDFSPSPTHRRRVTLACDPCRTIGISLLGGRGGRGFRLLTARLDDNCERSFDYCKSFFLIFKGRSVRSQRIVYMRVGSTGLLNNCS